LLLRYSGAMKFVVYTFVSAAFVVLVPVAFLRDPSVAGAALLAGAAVVYTALAVAVFLLCLQRYRRSARP
jgi:membrane associated rhomboid family serine protease